MSEVPHFKCFVSVLESNGARHHIDVLTEDRNGKRLIDADSLALAIDTAKAEFPQAIAAHVYVAPLIYRPQNYRRAASGAVIRWREKSNAPEHKGDRFDFDLSDVTLNTVKNFFGE